MASSERSRFRDRIPGVSTLQAALDQRVETVTRTARLDIVSGGTDEIDPPEDLDEFWNQYQTTGIVRSNVNTFVSDVIEPGVRVEADDETTVDYFMGGDSAPPKTPNGGFLANCFVHGGERHQPFVTGLETTIKNRWVRGTILVEKLRSDREDTEAPITGFYLILPETVYPRVYAHKNILLDPDPDSPHNEGLSEDGIELTPRGEVAAYIQFDDRSILGRRLDGVFEDRDEIRLSQNDVMKQVLDPDIGGDEADEQGIFGSSILESVTTDIAEYKSIKRDLETAIKGKAHGIYAVEFKKESIDLGDGKREIVEWDSDGQDSFKSDLENLSPADTAFGDGPFEMKRFEPDVPDLEWVLKHKVDDITSPLPAPKYAVGFEKDINQFVTERQETRYDDLVSQERRYQERKWTQAFREVAENHPDLNPSGLRAKIEPEEDDSPVRSLTPEEIDQIKTYAEALDLLAGPTAGPGTLVDDEALRELVAQLPEDAAPGEEAALPDGVSESDLQAIVDAGGDEPVGNGQEATPDE